MNAVTLSFQAPDFNRERNGTTASAHDRGVDFVVAGFDLDFDVVTVYPPGEELDLNLTLARKADYMNENGEECGRIGWEIAPDLELLTKMPALEPHIGKRYGRLIVTAVTPVPSESYRSTIITSLAHENTPAAIGTIEYLQAEGWNIPAWVLNDLARYGKISGWNAPRTDERGIYTYTDLRDFLDAYTDAEGAIQGDPATIAGEAATARRVLRDENFRTQIQEGDGGITAEYDAANNGGTGKAWVGPVDGAEPSREFPNEAAAEEYLHGEVMRRDPEGVKAGRYFLDVDRGEGDPA